MNIVRTPILVPEAKNELDNAYGYIYLTTCKINNKKYVGQHQGSKLDHNYLGTGNIITMAIKKYGKENFICKPIDWAQSKEELNQKEIDWIAKLGCVDGEMWYNIAPGGYSSRVWDEKARQEQSQRTKGSNNPRYHAIVTEETRLKQSKSMKGKMPGEKNPFYGKHHTEEDRKRMSLSHKEFLEKHPEVREKMRLMNLGRPSPMKGKKYTEEQRKNMHGKRPQISGENNPNYGNYWSEEQKEAARERIRNNKQGYKPIVQLSLTGEYLREFDSIKSAVEYLGVGGNGGLVSCLKHKTKRGSYKGFIWVYKKEYIQNGGDAHGKL